MEKFYAKIRPHLQDTEPEQLPSNTVEPSIAGSPDDKLFGRIREEELAKILHSYEEQQQIPTKIEKPVLCDTVNGRSFEKLLHSKPGFHHQGSTAYLVKKLGIPDVKRNSFLGGFSTYALCEEESLTGLKKSHNLMLLRKSLKKAQIQLSKKEYGSAKSQIDRALKLDPSSSEAFAMRGNYYASTDRHPQAIDDFKRSLAGQLEDRDSVKRNLSNSLYVQGMAMYHRREWRGALVLFNESLRYDASNDGAKLHKGLCEGQIRSETSYTSKSQSYRK